MFNPLTWLDSVLLDAAQKFCDKSQRLTGLTKFTFQKWALVAFNGFFWGGVVFSPDLFLVYMGLCQTSAAIFDIRQTEEEEMEFLRNGRLRSHSWVYIASVRLILTFSWGVLGILVLFTGTVTGLLFFYVTLCGIAHLYFSACIPRPPSKSKARELYEKALTWLNDRLQPTPLPAINQ